MDTPPPPSAPADYAGLKDELQKIAGIIEQYPDDLKQRAFELLIAAYLNSNRAKNGPDASEPDSAPVEDAVSVAGESVAPLAVEETVVESVPVAESEPVAESAPSEVVADDRSEPAASAPDFSDRPAAKSPSASEPGIRVAANSDNSANVLRKKIRLRPMTEMPWRGAN